MLSNRLHTRSVRCVHHFHIVIIVVIIIRVRVALTAALVGYPLGWQRSKVEALASNAGVTEQVTFFEDIPQEQVSRIVACSRVSVLLSREEGSNRAVYESMFCDTPVVVYAGHKGIDLEQVNDALADLREGRIAGRSIIRF